MPFLQLFVSKLIVILYFKLMSYDYMTSCRTIIDLMLYDYTLPSRTTIGAMSYDMRTCKHYSSISKVITLWFSVHYFPRSYFQYSHKIRICSEIPKSQRGKYKEKITSASFNSHCVAFLSLHINVLFIKVWQYVIHFYTTTCKPNQTFWLFQ